MQSVAADFPGALLRALNSLLANGAEQSVIAIEIYFVMTFLVIVVAGFPLLIFYSFIRFRSFRDDLHNAVTAKSRYVRGGAGHAG